MSDKNKKQEYSPKAASFSKNDASTTYTNKIGNDKQEERKTDWDNANKIHNIREDAKTAYNNYLKKKK